MVTVFFKLIMMIVIMECNYEFAVSCKIRGGGVSFRFYA